MCDTKKTFKLDSLESQVPPSPQETFSMLVYGSHVFVVAATKLGIGPDYESRCITWRLLTNSLCLLNRFLHYTAGTYNLVSVDCDWDQRITNTSILYSRKNEHERFSIWRNLVFIQYMLHYIVVVLPHVHCRICMFTSVKYKYSNTFITPCAQAQQGVKQSVLSVVIKKLLDLEF